MEIDKNRGMQNSIQLDELMNSPAARRFWLLYQAVRSLPFELALESARVAEMFVVGAPSESLAADAPTNAMASRVEPRRTAEQRRAEPPDLNGAAEGSAAVKQNGIALSPDQRDLLLAQLAAGAKNAELAREFGLSPKQVQGLRIGCAREITRRRALSGNGEPQLDQAPASTSLMEDIIRYLRQQDDVVVSQDDGGYLVNGRFPMTASELVVRANRMRARQRKPAFELRKGTLLSDGEPSKSHPLSWEDRFATLPVAANGSHKALG